MVTTQCEVVLIHGIGNQSRSWAQPFWRELKKALGADSARAAIHDAYWAPHSTVKQVFTPSASLGAPDQHHLEDDTYERTRSEFSLMLAADAGAPPMAYAMGLTDIWKFLKDKLLVAPDIAADVANYIARNAVRTAVQSVLHAALGAARASDPKTKLIIVSHSQGTVISYDVLRQAGRNYPGVRTWITMGSPLHKYLSFPLSWGSKQLNMPDGLRWLNLYDPHDFVGRELGGELDWPAPQPEDVAIDNESHATNAHDHWGNPQVVAAVTAEIRRTLV